MESIQSQPMRQDITGFREKQATCRRVQFDVFSTGDEAHFGVVIFTNVLMLPSDEPISAVVLQIPGLHKIFTGFVGGK